MEPITVVCDRCHKKVDGFKGDTTVVTIVGIPELVSDTVTSGYYQISTDGHGWGQFTNPGERIVCDECMWSDPRYENVFGPFSRGN